MTGECLSHEALADFTWGSFTGSRIRGWWWPQRYQVRISGNWMLPYLEKNLCRCVKNLWWDVYPGLCPWARNPVSNLLRKEMLGGPNPRTRGQHVATGKAMLASPDAERDGDGILPKRFWREHSLATTVIPAQKNSPDFQPPDCDSIEITVLSQQACVIGYSSHWKLRIYP